MFYFEKRGYTILTPFGDRNRYDVVIEKNNIFKRIQVKYVTIKNGIINVPLQSNTKINGKYLKHKYSSEDVDYIFVYTNNNNYLIPIEDVEGKSYVSLRLIKSLVKNNKIILAEKYELK